MSAELLHRFPQSIDGYCSDTQSEFCNQIEKTKAILMRPNSSRQSFLWENPDFNDRLGGFTGFSDTAKTLIPYIIFHYPLEFSYNSTKNWLELLLFRVDEDPVFRPRPEFYRNYKITLGDSFGQYITSRQATNSLIKIYSPYHDVTVTLYYISMIIGIISIIKNWKQRNSALMKFTTIVLLFTMINAFFMANVSVPHFRYLEPFIVLVLVMAFIIILNTVKEKFSNTHSL